jgi:hypothetical protein
MGMEIDDFLFKFFVTAPLRSLHILLGILLMWAMRRWPYEAFQAAQAGARAH